MSRGNQYKIKKLKWSKKKVLDNKGGFVISARCFQGAYEIIKDEFGKVYWSYYFYPYEYRYGNYCLSVADGKRNCQEHWENFLKEYLQKVKNKGE